MQTQSLGAIVDKRLFLGKTNFDLALIKKLQQTAFRSIGGRELRLLKIGRPQGGEMVLAHNLVFLVFTPLFKVLPQFATEIFTMSVIFLGNR